MDKVFQGYAGSLGIRDPAVVGKAREIYRRSTAMKTLLLGPVRARAMHSGRLQVAASRATRSDAREVTARFLGLQHAMSSPAPTPCAGRMLPRDGLLRARV